jgi:hypothetical protein
MKRIAILAATLAMAACAGTPPLTDELSLRDHVSFQDAHWYAYRGTLSQQAIWANPRTGLGGRVRASRDFVDDAGRSCRRFEEELRATDGRTEVRTGMTCLQDDDTLDIAYDRGR